MAASQKDTGEQNTGIKMRVLLLAGAVLVLVAVVWMVISDTKRDWKTFQKGYFSYAYKGKERPKPFDRTGWKRVLDLPLVDFINPRLTIRELQPDETYEDLHFAKVSSIEYCITCHLGLLPDPAVKINRNPYKSHPFPDLYVDPASPHPAGRFGCTICHNGQARSVNFFHVSHTPYSDSQSMAWEKQYEYRPNPVEKYRMIPSRFTQAACLDCHRNRLTVPGAPVLNRGRELFYEYGCHGCHALKYTDNMPVTGPTLRGINRKLTREWARTFIDSPQKVKPETRMPEFFHLSNSPEKNIEAIEIEAILEYLYNDSIKLESTVSRMPRGNVLQGKVLFDSIGCLGCHSLDTGIVPPAVNQRGLDKKLQRQWIMSWLKNPSAYNPKTLMPGLRLTKSEMADISAFLKGQDLAGHGFTMLAAPKWESRVDTLLKQRMEPAPSRVTRRLLQKLLPRQKLHRLGQKTILFYGCYGCHEIRNMENMNPVGSILDNEGSKNLSDLDFGGLMGKIPHERYAYFEQILKDPRLFDAGQNKAVKDRLRMPKYLLGEAYQDVLTCFLLGEKQNHAAASIRIKETQEDLAYKKGEYLMMEWKCYGCHILYRHNEPRRSSIRYYITDSTMAPPFLYLEGKKVEPNWLFSFLDSVQTVRPWLKVRMPSFDFSRDTLDLIVKHFEAEAGTPTIETYFDPARVSRRNINFGKKLFVQFKCETCHIKRGRAPRQRPRDQWAPDIALTPKRMRVEWIVKWLKDPQTYVPGTRMPNYFYDYDEDEKVFEPLIPNPGESILAMRDYLYTAYR